MTATPTLVRGLLGLLVVIAACWGTLLLTVPARTGDPVLVAVSPAAGEITKSPDEVRLTFDRPVSAGLATVRMTVPAGQQVVEGRPYSVSGDPNSLAVRMPPTRYGGTYSVAWSMPSGTLEPITGTSEFHVFAPTKPVAVPQISADRDPTVVAIHDVFRAAATAAFALGVGVAFVLVAVWPAGVAHAPARRPITYAWWALVVATVGTIVSFGGYAARLPLAEAYEPAVVSAAYGTDVGAVLLVRLLVLVPIAVALVQLVTGPQAGSAAQRWLRCGAVLAAGGALAATWSLARPLTPVAAAAEIALLLAVAICVGGPVLLWVLVRTAGDSVLRIALPRLARVMPVGGASLLVVAPLTTSGWQLVALLVLAALGVAAGLTGGWWERRRTSTRGRDVAGRARLRKLATAAAVTVAIALLVVAVPAAGPAQLAQSDGVQQAER
jgi:methionine-rich copper-binding protein CopC